MKKFYISFGQSHTHSKNSQTYNKDCLAEIEAESVDEAHNLAMSVFDGVFHNIYPEERTKDAKFMNFFPRGIIKI